MTIANKLYDRPHGFVGDVNATNPESLPVLYVDGELPSTIIGYAYEGRLQIHNAIGACTVELISGSLPNGNTISVDNSTQEIIIKWPKSKTNTADIPNANFSNGNDGSWELGAGWSIMSGVTPPDPNDPGDTNQAQFADVGGESTIFNKIIAPINGATHLTASCDVQQGGSSANKAGAAIRVQLLDEVGFQVGGADGNVVKSGSNSEWQTSTVSLSIPVSARYAKIGAASFRSSQNRPLWVDNFKWDLKQDSVGTTVSETFNITLKVVDSARRVAYWIGIIKVTTKITAWLYSNGIKYTNNDFSTVNTLFGLVSATSKCITWNGKFFIIYNSTPNIGDVYSTIDGTVFKYESTVPADGNTPLIYGLVSPAPNILIAVQNWSGIYRSEDSGKSWTRVLASSNSWGDRLTFARDGMVIAGRSGGAPVLYSPDSGITWGNIGSTNPPCGLIYFNGNFAVAFSSQNSILVYNKETDSWSSYAFTNPGLGFLRTATFTNDIIYLGGTSGVFSTQDFVTFTNLTFTGFSGSPTLYSDADGSVFCSGTGGFYKLIGGVFTLVNNDNISAFQSMAFAGTISGN